MLCYLFHSFMTLLDLYESFRIYWNLLEIFWIFLNLLKYFGICWNLLHSWGLQAHASLCMLMQAQMLGMCLGHAWAMLKLELLVAIMSLECSFWIYGAPYGLESILNLVVYRIKPGVSERFGNCKLFTIARLFII